MLKDRIVSMCVRGVRKKRIAKEKLALLVLLLECSLGICLAVWFSCGKDNMLAYIAGGKSSSLCYPELCLHRKGLPS